ncbi:MAG: metallothionein [Leptolyngbya sp.]|nr:MAG: metallothionein [Leptolyngbya sp.]
MATVTQMKCACESCLCIVTPGSGTVEKETKYYCSQACADGHKDGPGCGHTGCGCKRVFEKSVRS